MQLAYLHYPNRKSDWRQMGPYGKSEPSGGSLYSASPGIFEHFCGHILIGGNSAFTANIAA